MQNNCYLILEKDSLWLEKTALGWQLPTLAMVQTHYRAESEQLLLTINESRLYYIEWNDPLAPPASLSRFNLRECATLLDHDLFKAVGKAKQLLEWQRTHRFCGRCGHETQSADFDRARECPQCHFQAYPRISPCVLVAVYKKDQLLLARSPHFRPDLYSVLAGFIEAGESAEECAIREVYEEVGLLIGPLTYFGSQPWPFPSQLMLAYSAEYRGGEINADPIEIEHAQWFSPKALPRLAEAHTLAFQLIQHIVNTKLTN